MNRRRFFAAAAAGVAALAGVRPTPRNPYHLLTCRGVPIHFTAPRMISGNYPIFTSQQVYAQMQRVCDEISQKAWQAAEPENLT